MSPPESSDPSGNKLASMTRRKWVAASAGILGVGGVASVWYMQDTEPTIHRHQRVDEVEWEENNRVQIGDSGLFVDWRIEDSWAGKYIREGVLNSLYIHISGDNERGYSSTELEGHGAGGHLHEHAFAMILRIMDNGDGERLEDTYKFNYTGIIDRIRVDATDHLGNDYYELLHI